jgi:hypothetical protein
MTDVINAPSANIYTTKRKATPIAAWHRALYGGPSRYLFLRTSDACIYTLGDAAELPDGKIYAFIRPILDQAQWLAKYLSGQTQQAWQPPAFAPRANVHGFEAVHPYRF